MFAASVVVALPAWTVIAYWAGLYHEVEQRIDYNYVDEIGRIAVAATAWSWLFVLVRSLLAADATDQLTPTLLWMLIIPVLLLGRSLVRRYVRKQPWSRQNVAIIGEPADTEALLDRIDRHQEWGLDVKLEILMDGDGEVRERFERGPGESGPLPADVEVRESWLNLAKTPGGSSERDLAVELDRLGVRRALLVVGSLDLSARTRLIHELIETGIAVDQVSSGPETLYANSILHHLEGMPVLSVRSNTLRPFARAMKRSFDIAASVIGLLVFSPVLLWASIRIKRDSKGPVFYRQPRCGLDNESFELIKFRTMIDGSHSMRPELREKTRDSGNADVLFKIENDPRITRVGKKLRESSIDELPQLWNVLKGDMSMVGPRPLVFEEAELATDLFAARTRMKPGIAGPWQSLGRSSIPFEDMIKLDYSYVVGWSMSEDFKLLLRTLTAVTKRNNAL